MTATRRPTEVERQERIEAVYSLLARGQRPAQITSAIAEKYGCTRGTVRTRYLPRAREMMAQELAATKSELRARSMAFYRSVLEDNSTSTRDKIHSQMRIDKLAGLEVKEVGNGSEPAGGLAGRTTGLLAEIDRELKRRGLSVVGGDGQSTDAG